MDNTSSEDIFVSDVVGKEVDAKTLVSGDSEGEFLLENGFDTAAGEDDDYGSFFGSKDGVYSFVKGDSSSEEGQVFTVVDCNKQEIIRWAKNEDGEYVATVYTTDPETTGYSVNTTSLGMGFSLDGTLEDPTAGVGVNLDPLELKKAYSGNSSDTFEKDDVSSTAQFVDNFGDTVLVSESFLKYDSNGNVVEVQIFKDTFKNYIAATGISYNIDSLQTFTDFYAFDQQYDVFGNLSTDFSNSIVQAHESNDIAWGNIDTCLNSILETYKDAFQVGNLNISVVAETIKESLKDAKTKVETYLDEVSAEYSRVARVKKNMLAELAEVESSNNSGGASARPSGKPGNNAFIVNQLM